MTTGPNDILNQRMSDLRAAYAEHLPERVRAIEDAATAFRGGDSEALRTLYHHVHRLTGSAAVYGFAQLSRASAALEECLFPAWSGEAPVTTESVDSLAPMVAAIRQEMSAARAALGARPDVAR